jgi:glucose-6-phosphate 1-dehydrogenase
VQITMAESFGVEGRGAFYDQVGTIRDVIENHLLQVTACLAMDAPSAGRPETIRDEKQRLLESILPLRPENVVRGQFGGYGDERGVATGSQTETFAAVRLEIGNRRWAGVPFCIRAGKCLPITCTEVLVSFKPPPASAFGENVSQPNYVRFRLGPDVAIAIGVRSKTDGEIMVGHEVELLASQHAMEDTAYERLLGDAMKGDATMFAREDTVEAEWRIVGPVLTSTTAPYEYEIGSWGPAEANRLIEGGWYDPGHVACSH